MRTVFLLVVLAACTAREALKKCSDCPADTSPCDEIVRFINGSCFCSVCITRCSVRYNRCYKGEECIEVASNFSAKVKVAKCVPFSGCLNQTCDSECPVSGYLYDLNSCNTCLCNHLCAELQCPSGCHLQSSSFAMEPEPVCH